MNFKMKGWDGYVNSPMKQKDDGVSCYIDEDGNSVCPPKSDEEKKEIQDKIDAQIEGTYEPTEEDIEEMKKKDFKNLRRPN